MRKAVPAGGPAGSAPHFRKQAVAGWLFLLPALLLFGLFLFFPLGFAVYMSFTQWGMIGQPRWIGLANYVDLFRDPVFWTALKNTLIYTLSVPVKVALALLIAVALNMKVRALGLFRASFFFPQVISMVVVGILWQWMFSPSYGLINFALGALGLPQQSWLTRTDAAILVIIVAGIWRGLGNNLLIFLAGLQAIPASLYEAASVDGATGWQQFRHITVPLLRPTTLFVLIITMIGSFKVFDLVYTITGGGPGYSTTVMVQYVYQEAFQRFQMGYASAAAMVLFLILFILTVVQMRYFRGDEPW